MMMWTGFASAIAFAVVCASAGIPETPSDLKLLSAGTHEVKVTFIAGLDGGSWQTFTIDYNVKDRKPQVIRGIQAPRDTRNVTYTIRHLLAGTTYYIKVKAVNALGHSRFTRKLTATTSGTENTFTVTSWYIVAATIFVVLFAIATFLAVSVVVKLRRKNVASIAVQCDIRSPGVDLGEANMRDMEAAHVNDAFEGDSDPEHNITPTSGAIGAVEPDYVNVPRKVRESDSEVNDSRAGSYSPYAGLGMKHDEREEDHSYATLTTANTRF